MLRVEDSVCGVGGQLILGCVTDQTISVLSKSYIPGGDMISLIVRNDFYTTVLEFNSHTEK